MSEPTPEQIEEKHRLLMVLLWGIASVVSILNLIAVIVFGILKIIHK